MHSYIHKIFVYHNYVKSYFEIDIACEDKKKFRNLILTGKNGSGKTTLLKAINRTLFKYKAGIIPNNTYFDLQLKYGEEIVLEEVQKLKPENPKVEIQFGMDSDFVDEDLLAIYIPTQRLNDFKEANRKDKLDLQNALEEQNKKIKEAKESNLKIREKRMQISSLESELEQNKKRLEILEVLYSGADKGSIKTRGDELQDGRMEAASIRTKLQEEKNSLDVLVKSDSSQSPYTSLSEHFSQYLVDMKEGLAFAMADEETKEIIFYKDFFLRLEKLFQKLYEDPSLKLKHSFKQNKFYFEFANDVTADFNQIADGFKSVLVILSEILLQKEAFKVSKDMDEDPTGIVLIDELEAHLHLSIQEKILPALTSFFPKLQFIITTHSPQVCASDNNSYVYDISTDHLEKGYLGGISYDVLSKSHFGLTSEYSLYVTDLLGKTKKLMAKEEHSDSDKKKLFNLQEKLNNISPELAYELALFNEKIKKNG